MQTLKSILISNRRPHMYGVAAAVVLTLACPLSLLAQDAATTDDQRIFESPEAAAAALKAAFDNADEPALLAIFGKAHKELVDIPDKIQFKEKMTVLATAAGEAMKIEDGHDGTDSKTLVLGNEAWPFPIPLVKGPSGWRFDSAAGVEEIINRRVGQNELDAIELCQAYIALQQDYAAKDRDGDGVLEYAQRIGSTPGTKDGLYWDADLERGEEPSPIGPLIDNAALYIESAKTKPTPYHGYYYKIIKRQGASAPGGAYDFIINGNMIAGFALIACPADYGNSGVMTFMVSHHGKVYQMDLGEKTVEVAKEIDVFDPDDNWEAVED